MYITHKAKFEIKEEILEKPTTDTGHCIKCNVEISLDPSYPYCNKHKEDIKDNKGKSTVKENYCHECGRYYNTSSKFPLCHNCYDGWDLINNMWSKK